MSNTELKGGGDGHGYHTAITLFWSNKPNPAMRLTGTVLRIMQAGKFPIIGISVPLIQGGTAGAVGSEEAN